MTGDSIEQGDNELSKGCQVDATRRVAKFQGADNRNQPYERTTVAVSRKCVQVPSKVVRESGGSQAEPQLLLRSSRLAGF